MEGDIVASVLKKFVKTKMFVLLVLLAILTIVVTIGTNGRFLAVSNIRSILDSMVITAMLTIGAAMLLISGQLDLSMGTVGTAAAVMFAYLMQVLSWSWFPALILTLICAGVIGAINAALVNIARFPAFIATLGMAAVAEGLSYTFSNGAQIPVTDPFVRWVGSGRIADVFPISIILLAVAFVVYGIILAKTKFGRHMYLTGGNPQATRLFGINPRKVSFILFINSSLMGAMAGILLCSRVAAATATGIKDRQFFGLTAAILGGISFGGGTGGMSGAFVGLLIFSAFSNGMVQLRVESFWNNVIYGLLLLTALTFDYVSSRRSRKIKSAK
jgi:ribose/xylose/arabinose/galactoside ABC-type transport system permease subunit